MKRNLLVIGFLWFVHMTYATTFTVGALDGQFSNVDKINWSLVNPGDQILLKPGNYSGSLNTGKDGTKDNQIRVTLSPEANENNKVVLSGPIVLDNAWIDFDGIDQRFNRINAAPRPLALRSIVLGNQLESVTKNEAIGTRIRNWNIVGAYNSDNGFGVMVHVFSRGCKVENNSLYQSPGEDMMGVQNVGCEILNNRFYHHFPSPITNVHRDVISAGVPVGETLSVIGNTFEDIRTDCIIVLSSVGGTNQGTFDIENNIFSGMQAGLKFDSTRIVSIQKLVYRNNFAVNTHSVMGGEWPLVSEYSRNIFAGAGSSGNVFFGGGLITQNYFQTGTLKYQSSWGIQGDLSYDPVTYKLPLGSPASGYGPFVMQPGFFTPTPTPVPTVIPTPTLTPTPTPTPTFSPTPSPSPTPTPSPTSTLTPTPTPTPKPIEIKVLLNDDGTVIGTWRNP